MGRLTQSKAGLDAYGVTVTGNGMGGAVGELTMLDATVGALLIETWDALTRFGSAPSAPPDVERKTTGFAAQHLMKLCKTQPEIMADGMRDWLKRVVKAVETRNEIVHAAARDRCERCGRSSQYTYRGNDVDRSLTKVEAAVAEWRRLLDEGRALAELQSHVLNAALINVAKSRACATGQPQYPPQVRIDAILTTCVECTNTGSRNVALRAATAVAILPPGANLPSGQVNIKLED